MSQFDTSVNLREYRIVSKMYNYNIYRTQTNQKIYMYCVYVARALQRVLHRKNFGKPLNLCKITYIIKRLS